MAFALSLASAETWGGGGRFVMPLVTTRTQPCHEERLKAAASCPGKASWSDKTRRPCVPTANPERSVWCRPPPPPASTRAECWVFGGGQWFWKLTLHESFSYICGSPWAEVARWSASTCVLVIPSLTWDVCSENAKRECQTNLKYPLFYRKWHPQCINMQRDINLGLYEDD